MFEFYPVTPCDIKTELYAVRVNGREAELDTMRVSKHPFNRRWPGHQRQSAQTELTNFLSMCADEPLHFEVTLPYPSERVIIRPKSPGITPVVRDNKVYFTLEKPGYFTLEPYGRHEALHVFVDAPCDYDADKSCGDVIYFGKGVHHAGCINLKSGQTLFIDKGAVVYADVRAMDARNIRIIGNGILDCSHNREEILFEANEENNFAAVNNAVRRHSVQLEYCTNVLIDGITIRDSLLYNIRPVGCENLYIQNVKIIGCWRYNSDGIDMHNCVNVVIDNCFLRTFDDCICVKGFDCYYEGGKQEIEEAVNRAIHHGGKVFDTFKNVLVKNCVLWNDWGKCLEIGAETRARNISGVTFENCDIIHVTGPVLDVCSVDYAHIHDIIYRHINIEFDDIIPFPVIQNKDSEEYPEGINPDYAPAVCSSEVSYHAEYSAGGTQRGINEGIVFEDIHLLCDAPLKPRLFFKGYSDVYCVKDITVKGFYLNGKKLESTGDFDIVCNEFVKGVEIIS